MIPEVRIYCGGKLTFAYWLLGKHYCHRCGESVRVVW